MNKLLLYPPSPLFRPPPRRCHSLPQMNAWSRLLKASLPWKAPSTRTTTDGEADERADCQALFAAQEQHIETLITVRATSNVGLRAKASVVRAQFLVGRRKHQSIAFSLADDLVGGDIAAALSPAPHTTYTADPIFDIIEKHQAVIERFKEAVRIEFAYEKCQTDVEAMGFVELQTYESAFQRLEEATSDAGDRMHEASTDLLNAPPTSLAGIVALCEYFGPLIDDEQHHFPDEIDWDDGTQSTPAGAFANAIGKAVAAMVRSSAATSSRSPAHLRNVRQSHASH